MTIFREEETQGQIADHYSHTTQILNVCVFNINVYIDNILPLILPCEKGSTKLLWSILGSQYLLPSLYKFQEFAKVYKSLHTSQQPSYQ